jgi:hypothetical protein
MNKICINLNPKKNDPDFMKIINTEQFYQNNLMIALDLTLKDA